MILLRTTHIAGVSCKVTLELQARLQALTKFNELPNGASDPLGAKRLSRTPRATSATTPLGHQGTEPGGGPKRGFHTSCYQCSCLDQRAWILNVRALTGRQNVHCRVSLRLIVDHIDQGSSMTFMTRAPASFPRANLGQSKESESIQVL